MSNGAHSAIATCPKCGRTISQVDGGTIEPHGICRICGRVPVRWLGHPSLPTIPHVWIVVPKPPPYRRK